MYHQSVTENQRHQIVVDFIVSNPDDKTILIQQRSGTRKLFPYCWEFIGGHLESGETIEDCIKRELHEESTMELVRVIGKLNEFFWSYDNKIIKDLVYMIEAKGNFQLEAGKAIDVKWITRDQAYLILKPGETTNGLYEAALKAFELMDKNATETSNVDLRGDNESVQIMSIKPIGIRYIDLLSVFGQAETRDLTKEFASLFSPDVRKIINSQIICRNQTELVNQMRDVKSVYGMHTVTLHELIIAADGTSNVIRWEITFPKDSTTETVITILKSNSTGLIEEINEVFGEKHNYQWQP